MKTADKPTTSEPEGDRKTPPPGAVRRFFGDTSVMLFSVLVLTLLIKAFLFQAFYIPSGSMIPTLKIGDRVIVNKLPYYLHDPRRGDIVVFSSPHAAAGPDRGVVGGAIHWFVTTLGVEQPENPDYIKRVIGLPGDTVSASGGHVYVNGKPISEPYLTVRTGDFPATKVPPGDLFVMGDNRSNSLDSRFRGPGMPVGFVPIDKVIGKAVVTIWPTDRFGLLH